MFRSQDKYDLSIVYTDVLKKTALQYGPNSPEVMRALIDLDDVFQVIFLWKTTFIVCFIISF